MTVRYLAILVLAASCSSGLDRPATSGRGGTGGGTGAGTGGTVGSGGTAGPGGAGSAGGATTGSGGTAGSEATAGSGGAGNVGGATAGSGGAGNVGGATAGSGGTVSAGGTGGGGACPAEVPVYGLPLGAANPYATCCPVAPSLYMMACTTKNLLCWSHELVVGCYGDFQYRCDGNTFMATPLHYDPSFPCTGTGGSGGRGGSGGSGGTGGGQTGGGSGGGGQTGGGGGAAGALIGPPRSTDPWNEGCVSGTFDRPAGPAYLTGPYEGSGLGSAPLSGESVTATLNGLARAFSTSLTVAPNASGSLAIAAYGSDGYVILSVPMSGPGSYTCPYGDTSLSYANLRTGWEGNWFRSNTNCCRIEITKAGAVGEIVEGTFSGILNSQLNTWVEVEQGSFKVVRR